MTRITASLVLSAVALPHSAGANGLGFLTEIPTLMKLARRPTPYGWSRRLVGGGVTCASRRAR